MLSTTRLRKADPARIIAHDEIKTLWTVENTATNTILGYLASSPRKYTSPSTGKVRHPIHWGYAVHVDEFLSGIQFIYMSRAEALRDMARTVSL